MAFRTRLVFRIQTRYFWAFTRSFAPTHGPDPPWARSVSSDLPVKTAMAAWDKNLHSKGSI